AAKVNAEAPRAFIRRKKQELPYKVVVLYARCNPKVQIVAYDIDDVIEVAVNRRGIRKPADIPDAVPARDARCIAPIEAEEAGIAHHIPAEIPRKVEGVPLVEPIVCLRIEIVKI